MGKVYWAVTTLSSEDGIPALRAYLDRSFPLGENQVYLDRLMGYEGRSALPRVVAARLGALALLPPMLALAGIQPAGIRFTRDENGRPYGRYVSEGGVPFDFNLSHSDAHAVCTLLIGDGRVGVDVEEPVSVSRALPLIRRYCTEGELKMLMGRTEREQAQIFTRIWTLREAISKQDGRGYPLKFDASLVPDAVRVFCASLPDTGTQISICTPADVGLADLIEVSAGSDVLWEPMES